MSHTNSLVSMIFLFVIFYGESYGQWQRMNLPAGVKVNTIEIKDSFIFAGTERDGIFESTDDGESWTSSNRGLQDTLIHTIMILGNSIFAGTETGVSVSTDNGEGWRSIDSGLSGLGVWSLGGNCTSIWGHNNFCRNVERGLFFHRPGGELESYGVIEHHNACAFSGYFS